MDFETQTINGLTELPTGVQTAIQQIPSSLTPAVNSSVDDLNAKPSATPAFTKKAMR